MLAENQYVIFNLNSEEFGIDIMNVKEIIPYQESVNVPNTPEFVEGIINYRGKVIPIINLKKRLNLSGSEITKDTRIIVITFDDKDVGFVVDEASQTMVIEDEQIDPTPDIISEVDRRFITGVGKIGEERLLILLDLHNILTDEEKQQIEKMEIEQEV
ncbi:MAG: chemotaxis protein CheW [Tissierellia bacterium]|nr:chemotaxis protein CheW [Tissierellia bacterium]